MRSDVRTVRQKTALAHAKKNCLRNNGICPTFTHISPILNQDTNLHYMKIMGLQKSNFIPASLRTGLASLLLIGAATNSPAGTSTLNANDTLGQSSFNANTHWSGGLAPGPGTNFFTAAFTLRTPTGSQQLYLCGRFANHQQRRQLYPQRGQWLYHQHQQPYELGIDQ